MLLIEDESAARRLARSAVEAFGLECGEACDAASALKTLQKERYDLVLLDLNLPDMDGYELCQLLRQDPREPHLKIIVVSARGDPNQPVLKPLATLGLPEQYVQACGDVRIGDQCCGRAVQQRKPWIVSDMLEDPLFASAKKAAQVSPIRAAFSVPVIDERGHCLGSLGCHYDHPHVPTREDIERNEIWASMIAHVISRYSGQTGAQPAAVLQKTQRMQQDEGS